MPAVCFQTAAHATSQGRVTHSEESCAFLLYMSSQLLVIG